MTDETASERKRRLSLERRCAALGRRLKAEEMPENVGFALVMFDYGEAGSMAYVGSGQRADVINMLEELLRKLRAAS